MALLSSPAWQAAQSSSFPLSCPPLRRLHGRRGHGRPGRRRRPLGHLRERHRVMADAEPRPGERPLGGPDCRRRQRQPGRHRPDGRLCKAGRGTWEVSRGGSSPWTKLVVLSGLGVDYHAAEGASYIYRYAGRFDTAGGRDLLVSADLASVAFTAARQASGRATTSTRFPVEAFQVLLKFVSVAKPANVGLGQDGPFLDEHRSTWLDAEGARWKCSQTDTARG